LFNLHFSNPFYFLAALALVLIGGLRGWLSQYELILASVLLAIPYITKGYEMHMGSCGRYASVVFPAYLVLGNALSRMPAPIAAAVCALSACVLGVYAALYAAGYAYY